MPAPIAAAAIAAGASALGTGGQIYAAGKMNKKTREWNEKMYGRQRQDQIDDWNRVNAYNSPAEQMSRFKAAGLNPNLIYGQSNEAPSIRGSDMAAWNPDTPDIAGGVNNAIRQYQDFTLQDEQVKNMQRQRENMEMDTLLKSADLAAKNLAHDQARILFDTTIKTAEEKLRKSTVDTDNAISEELRRKALHAPTLERAILEVANTAGRGEEIKAQIDNLRNTNVLQKLEIALREKGLSYGDNVILRVIARLADGSSLSDILKNMWNGLKN